MVPFTVASLNARSTFKEFFSLLHNHTAPQFKYTYYPSSHFIVNIFFPLPSYLNRCTLARALNSEYNAANRIQSCYESGPPCPYSIYLFHYCVNHTNTVLECSCGIFFTKALKKFSSTIALKLCMRLVEVFFHYASVACMPFFLLLSEMRFSREFHVFAPNGVV